MKTKIIFLLAVMTLPWYSGYNLTWDGSTGCQYYPVDQNDVRMLKAGSILQLTANSLQEPAKYVGAIARKDFTFEDDKHYTLSGKLRKAAGDVEQIAVNIQYVDMDYNEHFAEILWTLNPWATDVDGVSLYGWVWTRNTHDGTVIRLAHIGDDNLWHNFSITAFHSGETHIIESITFDGVEYPLGIEEGTMVQPQNNHLSVLLEVQNMYTNCSPSYTFVGRAEFRNVSLTTHP